MIRAAFDLSEKYATPVIVRSSTRVSHASTFFEVADETCAKEACGGGWVPGESWVTLPVKSYWSHKRILENLDKIAADYSTDDVLSAFNTGFESGVADAGGSARLGIVAGGVSVEAS